MEQERELDNYDTASPIRNRDIKTLTNVKYIMAEIQRIEERCEWQRARQNNITQHLSGMPHGSGGNKGLDDAFSVLWEVEKEHEEKCREYASQIRAAKRIMNSIPTQSMRTFVDMRYVMGVSDVDIRKELGMSKRGFYRAREAIEQARTMAEVRWPEKFILT